VFIEQDTPARMYARAGLDTAGIVASALAALGKERREAARRADLR
jgi:hypothetical protein